jgi:CHAD domain-containing protein
MPIRRKRHETPVAALLRTTIRRLLSAQQLLAIETDSERAIHLARRQCKRVKAVLRLLRAMLEQQTYAYAYDQAGSALRQLGGARDADVMLATARQLSLEDERWAALALSLARRRNALDQGQLQLTQARQALALLLRLMHALWAPTPSAHAWKLLSQALQRDYRRARQRIPRQHNTSEEVWHNWRKAVKTHGIQLEALRDAVQGPVVLRQRRINRLGDLLGWEHDVQMLAQVLDNFGSDTDVTPLQQRLTGLREHYQREAKMLGQQLFHAKPHRFARRLQSPGDTKASHLALGSIR